MDGRQLEETPDTLAIEDGLSYSGSAHSWFSWLDASKALSLLWLLLPFP